MSSRKPYLKKIIAIMSGMNCIKQIDELFESLPYRGPIQIFDVTIKGLDKYYVGNTYRILATEIDKEEFDLWKQIDNIYVEKLSL